MCFRGSVGSNFYDCVLSSAGHGAVDRNAKDDSSKTKRQARTRGKDEGQQGEEKEASVAGCWSTANSS